MIIRGEWGDDGAPYVATTVYSRAMERPRRVLFLVDSGANNTTILDRDAVAMDVQYDQLVKRDRGATGVGGTVDAYQMRDVILYFESNEGLHMVKMSWVNVLRHQYRTPTDARAFLQLPSLLGRDLLNRHEVILNRKKGLVLFRD